MCPFRQGVTSITIPQRINQLSKSIPGKPKSNQSKQTLTRNWRSSFYYIALISLYQVHFFCRMTIRFIVWKSNSSDCIVLYYINFIYSEFFRKISQTFLKFFYSWHHKSALVTTTQEFFIQPHAKVKRCVQTFFRFLQTSTFLRNFICTVARESSKTRINISPVIRFFTFVPIKETETKNTEALVIRTDVDHPPEDSVWNHLDNGQIQSMRIDDCGICISLVVENALRFFGRKAT